MKENEKFFSGEKTFLDGKRTFLNEIKEEKESEIKQEPKIQTAKYVGSFHIDSLLKEGDTVKMNQKLGEIKMLGGIKQEILAEESGVITEILQKEGAPVDYGLGLFVIIPTSKK